MQFRTTNRLIAWLCQVVGWFVLSCFIKTSSFLGELHTPRKYDLVKHGLMKLTVRGLGFDDALCLNGESKYIAIPSKFCRVNLCEFIGEDICRILEQPGIHTIKELEEKLGFNSTLELPEPPSLLGISMLDLFSVSSREKESHTIHFRESSHLDSPSNTRASRSWT